MILPADLLHAQINVFTSGTINTQVSTALVAAPGAGLRLRLWTADGGFALSSFTGTKLILFVQASSAANRHVMNASLGQPSTWLWIPGGDALPMNLAMVCVHSCDVATQSIAVSVGYTIEKA